MKDRDRGELAIAVTQLLAADLRRQILMTPAVFGRGQIGDLADSARTDFVLAARRVGAVVNPTQPDEFVDQLQQARQDVLDELDPFGLRAHLNG